MKVLGVMVSAYAVAFVGHGLYKKSFAFTVADIPADLLITGGLMLLACAMVALRRQLQNARA